MEKVPCAMIGTVQSRGARVVNNESSQPSGEPTRQRPVECHDVGSLGAGPGVSASATAGSLPDSPARRHRGHRSLLAARISGSTGSQSLRLQIVSSHSREFSGSINWGFSRLSTNLNQSSFSLQKHLLTVGNIQQRLVAAHHGWYCQG